ncbi:small-conductance mechanosensitive channel [Candidatus Midichloria mitochondrii IricVA]|uniref:Small-conductance mechanosensitive channel n=2 Tax=Candidatus Midichloria mitochondrii TaxID=234827 RepID=F7XVF3_MIDMI|nr:small-conductance mechanosensitive channel [Candidatus Midichloria mitochondrii IricVA]
MRMVESPLPKALWIFSIAYIAELICRYCKLPFDLIAALRMVAIIFVFAQAAILEVDKLEAGLIAPPKKNTPKMDKVAIDIPSKLIKAIIYIVAALAIMQALGVNINGILALGGISGLAVGFASRELLSNFFGTIMIYLDKPFIIGEFVRVEGRNCVGTIEKVDWRMTTVRTEDKKQVFIPNSAFLTASIENSSRLSHRIFSEEIKVLCADYKKIIGLIKDIKSFIKTHKEIDGRESISIDIIEISQNVIRLSIKGFSKYTEVGKFGKFRNNLLVEIAEMVKKHDLLLA